MACDQAFHREEQFRLELADTGAVQLYACGTCLRSAEALRMGAPSSVKVRRTNAGLVQLFVNDEKVGEAEQPSTPADCSVASGKYAGRLFRIGGRFAIEMADAPDAPFQGDICGAKLKVFK